MDPDIPLESMGLDPFTGSATGTNTNPDSLDQVIAAAVRTGEHVTQTASAHPQSALLLLFVVVLAAFLGFELIRRVPAQLHTPLMSGANAISGITIVGALLAVSRTTGALSVALGTVAVVLATINVVGGYLVTDRMLAMFKQRGKDQS